MVHCIYIFLFFWKSKRKFNRVNLIEGWFNIAFFIFSPKFNKAVNVPHWYWEACEQKSPFVAQLGPLKLIEKSQLE
jgi:hypothetical protein